MIKEIHDINTRALDFVVELIEYIFEYPDDDYMTMECLCRKLVKHGLLDKADGYYQTHEIRTNTHECVKDTHDKTESSSEKPNNCEHITEDGVTCAKYPACDDCLDNPLNKVKGSERLVKGSEQTDLVEDSPSLVKDLVKAFGEDGTWLERQGVYTLTLAEAKQRAVDIIESVLAKDEPTISKMEQVEDEPQTFDKPPKCLGCWYSDLDKAFHPCASCVDFGKYVGEVSGKDEPQTDCAWR